MPDPNLINVGIPRETHESLSNYCEKTNRIVRRTLATLIESFLAMPPVVKRVLIKDVERGFESAYAEALRYLASQAESGNLSSEDDDSAAGPLAKIGPRTPKDSGGVVRAGERDAAGSLRDRGHGKRKKRPPDTGSNPDKPFPKG